MKVPLAAHFTELLDDRILLGNLKSESGFFITTHAHFAEITFQLRPYIDLDATLALLRHQCSRLSDPNAPHLIASHTARILIYTLDPLSTKLRAPDTTVPPEMSIRLSNMLHALLETLCTRLRASIMIGERVYALKDGTASDDLKQLVALEQSRTVPVLPYLASETFDSTLNGTPHLSVCSARLTVNQTNASSCGPSQIRCAWHFKASEPSMGVFPTPTLWVACSNISVLL